MPFGSFEEVLKQAKNKKIKKELDAAIKDIPDEKAEEALSKCRDLVMQVPQHLCQTCDACCMMYCSAVKGIDEHHKMEQSCQCWLYLYAATSSC